MVDTDGARATERLVEAMRRFEDDPDTRDALVASAVECLVVGVDSPSLRELAGATYGAPHEVLEPLLDGVVDELGLPGRPGVLAEDTDATAAARAAVDLVLRDARSSGLALEVGVRVEHDAYGSGLVRLDLPDGTGSGVWVDGREDDPVDELVRVTDSVHDWLVEALPSRGLPTNWPRCPQHPDTHPLEVRRHGGTAAWTCPRSGVAHATVGELGSSS